MNFEPLLEQIGLTKSEIKVYLALLELGSSTTGPIVDQSKASSSKIYEILEKLMQKGLASVVIKSGTKHFEAADPNRILDYMREKEEKLQLQKKELLKAIPQLKLKRKLSKDQSETLVFKGMKGAKTAFDDILSTLKKGEEMLALGFSDVHENFQQFLIRFHQKRAAQGIKTRMIFGEKLEGMVEQLRKTKNAKIKFHPPQKGDPVAVITYANKTLFSLAWDNVWIQITNKRLADSNRVRFEEIWNQDVTVVKGWDSLLSTLTTFMDEIDHEDTFDALGTGFGVKGKESKYAKVFSKFHTYRKQKGIQARWLFEQGTQKIIEENHENYQEGEVKFLPYATDSPVGIHPYEDKTLLVIQGKVPTTITINNKLVTQAFKKNFELLWNQKVNVYSGFENVMDKFESMLDTMKAGEEYQVLGATYGRQGQKLSKWFFEYHKKRIQKKIHVKLLTNKETFDEVMIQLTKTGDPEQKTGWTKKLADELSSPMQINLYPNGQVLMFLFGEEMTCFEIDSPIIYHNFKLHFESLWNQETRIVKGIDAIRDIFEDMLNYGHCDFIGARGYYIDRNPKHIKEWEKKAKEKGFTMRNITDEQTRGHHITKFSFASTKYTISKEFSVLSVFWIYGNKVVISNWVDDEPIATIIENTRYFDLYKKQFEELWKK